MKVTTSTTPQFVYPTATEFAGAFIIQNLDATNGIWCSIHGTASNNPVDATLDVGFDSFFIGAGQSLIIDDGGLDRRVGGRISVVAAAGTPVCNVCRLR